MNQTHSTILVASDSTADAKQVQELLTSHFPQVLTSTVPEKYQSDFEQYQPSVLVLAFQELERAESYYLGLYRRSQLATVLPHRTLVLCHKDVVKHCYELCLKECFDDYVLFWPMAYDGNRLPMSVLLALRAIAGRHAATAHAEASGKSIQFPAYAAPSLAEQERIVALGTTGIDKSLKNVLIVEDDDFQRKLLGKLLADMNCNLHFAQTGEAVLDSVRRLQPCLILMDIMLPGMSGVDVTHQLKANPALAQTPVIMITGNSDRMAVARSLKAGAIDFVVKPFNRDIMRKKVQKFLD